MSDYDTWLSTQPDTEYCPECLDPFDASVLTWTEHRDERDGYTVIRSEAKAPCGHRLHDYDLEGTA